MKWLALFCLLVSVIFTVLSLYVIYNYEIGIWTILCIVDACWFGGLAGAAFGMIDD